MWHLAYSEGVQEEGPGARHSHSAVVHDQAMWVFGGMCDLQPRNVCGASVRTSTRPVTVSAGQLSHRTYIYFFPNSKNPDFNKNLIKSGIFNPTIV